MCVTTNHCLFPSLTWLSQPPQGTTDKTASPQHCADCVSLTTHDVQRSAELLIKSAGLATLPLSLLDSVLLIIHDLECANPDKLIMWPHLVCFHISSAFYSFLLFPWAMGMRKLRSEAAHENRDAVAIMLTPTLTMMEMQNDL